VHTIRRDGRWSLVFLYSIVLDSTSMPISISVSLVKSKSGLEMHTMAKDQVPSNHARHLSPSLSLDTWRTDHISAPSRLWLGHGSYCSTGSAHDRIVRGGNVPRVLLFHHSSLSKPESTEPADNTQPSICGYIRCICCPSLWSATSADIGSIPTHSRVTVLRQGRDHGVGRGLTVFAHSC